MENAKLKPCQDMLLKNEPIRRRTIYDGSLEITYNYNCPNAEEGFYVTIHMDEDEENTPYHENLIKSNIAKGCKEYGCKN